MKILGIDPGYERLGIAILERNDGEKEKLIFSETFQTDKKIIFIERLFLVVTRIEEIIKIFKPEVLSIEKLFFNTNQKTATNVSEVRGAIIFTALKNKLLVAEYTPLEIKTAITGYGRSDKKQVTYMTSQLIKVDTKIKYDDEWDAIAVALTFFAYNQKNK